MAGQKARSAVFTPEVQAIHVFVDAISSLNKKIVMAGLVPAIHVLLNAGMAGGFVYIVTNRRDGILYTGVTSDLIRRVHEHREGLIEGFTKTHGLQRLVWFEVYDDIRSAIQREKNIKHWPRAWKVRLIPAENLTWRDLFDDLH